MTLKEFFKNQIWVQILTRDIPFIRLFIVYESYSQRFKKDIGLDYPPGVSVLKKGIFGIYRSKRGLINFGNDFLAVKNKTKFFENISKKTEQVKKEAEKSIRLCNKLIKEKENNFIKLKKAFRLIHRALKNFWSLQWSPMALEFSLNTINRPDILQRYKKYFVGIRQKSQHTTVKLEDLLDKILRKIAQTKNLPGDLIFYATPAEILKDKVIKNNLIARKKSSVLGARGSKVIIFVGKKARKIAKHIVSPQGKISTDVIKGSPAYGGKVKGAVRVIFYREDLKKIKNREILVTPMTEAFYTPYLKKVKAIITDEGGITCHAAIISREMKIPCIIGTKIATKVLKDGDLVEVDAERGVVKILKRK